MTILTVTLHPAIDKAVRTARLVPDEISRVKIEMVYAGGKGNNAARALAHLGVDVLATGYQSGYTGDFATQSLEAEGVKTSFVKCTGVTRTSTLVQEDETGHTFAIYEPGQEVLPAEADDLLRHYESLLGSVSVVMLCGSGQTEVLAPVYGEMIKIGHRHGVKCLLDSSGGALLHGIAARPALVKVNKHELGDYLKRSLPDRDAQLQALLEVQALGIDIVAISRGPDGMIATDGKEAWEAWVGVERVVNVVGCGDSALAGMATALERGGGLKEIVSWGVACGTANTQVRGAGFLDKDTVQALFERMQVRPVALPAQLNADLSRS